MTDTSGASGVIDLAEKFALVDAHWQPHVIARVNDTEVKVVRIKGEFDWHHHETEDELFWVISGRMLMQFRDRDVWVEAGQLVLVPHGVEHRPVAPQEVQIVLIEPAGTLNTGNVVSERTVMNPKQI